MARRGLSLIEQRVELYDRRFMRSSLTEGGRALVRQIANALQGRRRGGLMLGFGSHESRHRIV
jgi:DNA-binding MarR family transcriptional regulator